MSSACKTVADFWTVLIIRELLTGTKRFNELLDNVSGITNTTLSDKLKKLNEANLVERNQYNCIPVKVEYSLTTKGKDLEAVISGLEQYSNKWFAK